MLIQRVETPGAGRLTGGSGQPAGDVILHWPLAASKNIGAFLSRMRICIFSTPLHRDPPTPDITRTRYTGMSMLEKLIRLEAASHDVVCKKYLFYSRLTISLVSV